MKITKTSLIRCLLFSLAILTLIAGATACGQPDSIKEVLPNEEVINFKDFSIDASSKGWNTRTSGVIFVLGDPEGPEIRRVQIVASVEIAPADDLGILFSIPTGWYITSYSTDYPQGRPDPEIMLSPCIPALIGSLPG